METTRDLGVGMTMGRTSVNGLNGREASLRASPTLKQPELRDIRLLTATCHAPAHMPMRIGAGGHRSFWIHRTTNSTMDHHDAFPQRLHSLVVAPKQHVRVVD
ncbi:hypothetical protein C8F01DRAFT_1244077 [Mycena amicta]|nr:hypothetical protein C8F01DRAFT_1244077 [Mycena amicta]